MTGDQRKSLWADPLPDEFQQHPDVVARVLPDEPEAPPPPRDVSQQPLRPGAVAIGVLLALVIVALATAHIGRGSLTVADVPSRWGDVPMTCRTTRLEQAAGALELFRCHALGIGALPPG